MSKNASKSNAKVEKFLADGLAIIDCKIEKVKATGGKTANYDKKRKLFVETHKTLCAASYDVKALELNVHQFNTKDYGVALMIEGKQRYVHDYIACIFKTAFNFAKKQIELTYQDISNVCDARYKIDEKKRERDALYVLNTNTNTGQIDAQESQAKNSLEAFGVLKPSGKKAYTVDLECKTAKALIALYGLE